MTRPATSDGAPTTSAQRRQRSRSAGARARQYEVKYMPPPWKRSLTESGMSRKATRWDVLVVIALVIVLVVLFAWAVVGGHAAT